MKGDTFHKQQFFVTSLFQLQQLCARVQCSALFLAGVEIGGGVDPSFCGSGPPPTPANLQSQDVVVAAFAVATNSNCCLAHAMKLSAAVQSVKVKAAAASAFIVDYVISVLQESMWIKPFAEFAPRMRVMRYSSERRLQTPNIAAHYKKELCVLLKVTDTHNMINKSLVSMA